MFVALWILFTVINLSEAQTLVNCPSDQVRFQKILGLKPPKHHHPLLLYKSENPAIPVTLDCLKKCQENEDCLSFVLHYNTSHCFWFKNPAEGFPEEENALDNSVAWFSKTCLNAKNCDKKWIFERVPGAILIGNDAKLISNNITRQQCQQYCLQETSFECRSIKFRIIQSTKAKVLGQCILSDTDRHLMPNSFRVSTFNEEYFENQCTKATESEFCAFEEFQNSTLVHVDDVFEKKTKDECKELCESTKSYHCRGYSISRTDGTRASGALYKCLLHAEDSKVHGPKLINDVPGGQYFEKAPCLNISVTCTETYMTVKFQPEYSFNGKIYMQGYSDRLECFALGQGTNLVQLKIPLLGKPCGIVQANSNVNRTLLSTTMVLQYNSLIQTQSDRIIKVGCLYGNTSKVLIGTGVNFTLAPPNFGTTHVNTNSNLPNVEMKIIDLNTQNEVSDTQIGQELQLIVEMKPPNKAYDIWAGHLVAMTETGQESILLLDDQGCPTNIEVFPILAKIRTNTTVKLQATFQAFKFSSSSIIRFSVIVQFCPGNCPSMTCDGTMHLKVHEGMTLTPTSSEKDNTIVIEDNLRNLVKKSKRALTSNVIHTVNGTSIINVTRDEFDTKGKNGTNEVPLDYIIVVRNGKIQSDRLIYGEGNKILVAGYDSLKNEFCINDSLLIAIIIIWIIIQTVMVVSCVVLIRRYKRYYESLFLRQSTEELNRNFGYGFSTLDNRRVHFADNRGFSNFH